MGEFRLVEASPEDLGGVGIVGNTVDNEGTTASGRASRRGHGVRIWMG